MHYFYVFGYMSWIKYSDQMRNWWFFVSQNKTYRYIYETHARVCNHTGFMSFVIC